MNKYINTDLENALKYSTVAIMNIIEAVEYSELKEFTFNYISLSLFKKCLKDRNWELEECDPITYSKNNMFLIIEGNDKEFEIFSWKLL